jgi:hypothetical protein
MIRRPGRVADIIHTKRTTRRLSSVFGKSISLIRAKKAPGPECRLARERLAALKNT